MRGDHSGNLLETESRHLGEIVSGKAAQDSSHSNVEKMPSSFRPFNPDSFPCYVGTHLIP